MHGKNTPWLLSRIINPKNLKCVTRMLFTQNQTIKVMIEINPTENGKIQLVSTKETSPKVIAAINVSDELTTSSLQKSVREIVAFTYPNDRKTTILIMNVPEGVKTPEAVMTYSIMVDCLHAALLDHAALREKLQNFAKDLKVFEK